ncbi:PREDICTED: uncharacterized protein C12orf56-like [Priapulus caudatus]|uniref:Uncharacterized protein C12orf56-like n=1 Tax=Priapulus caudatus TaxID=37621 RepID=A0ABM1F5B0_PRICU|nr:PREDICTED: uncharacterized protein C12orf56-like [Priapulus caudatus]
MARNGGEGFLLKKGNEKLDSFLKRSLSQDEYEYIRAYDACIVVSEKEHKSFKYVVLTNQRIYLTENPPKSIYEAANVKDVLGVELVHDFPDFLSGEYRNSSQHITITLTTQLKRKSGQTQPNYSPRQIDDAVKRSLFEEQLSRKPTFSLLLENPSNAPQTTAPIPNRKPRFCKLSTSIDETWFRPVKRSQNAPLRSLSLGMSNSIDERQMSKLRLRESGSDMHNVPHTHNMLGHRHMPQNSVLEEFKNTLSADSSHSLQSATGSLSFDNHSHSSLKNASETVNVASESSEQDVRPDCLDFDSGKQPDRGSLQGNYARSHYAIIHSDASWCEATAAEGSTVNRKTELHLYILEKTSPMLLAIRSAWQRYQIVASLAMDKSAAIQPRKTSQLTSEQMGTLYWQLHGEIMRPNNSLRETYSLVSELRAAAQRYFVIRKLFWKSAELLWYFINHLHRHLVVQPVTSDYLDELDLAVLCLETITLMMTDTDMVANKLNIFRENRGKCTVDLLHVLINIHTIVRPDAESSDTEAYKMQEELMVAAVALLYELFQMGRQISWLPTGSGTSKFNIAWLVNKLAIQSSLEQFVSLQCAQMFQVLQAIRGRALNAVETVQLLHHFSLLCDIMDNSPKLRTLVIHQYSVDFRYYVNPRLLWDSSLHNYAILPHLLHLVEKAIGHVDSK